jgi:hypothetical protein
MEAAETKSWMRKHATPGLVVVIRAQAAMLDEFVLDVITEVGKGRVYVQGNHLNVVRGPRGSRSYYLTGQSCAAPKGQVKMLVPTPDNVKRAVTSPGHLLRRTSPELLDRAKAQTLELFGTEISIRIS